MHTRSLKKKLLQNDGASLVIALVFFLICAVVGSTVLTAASINAKAAQTYEESRQMGYTINSAASLVSSQVQQGVSVAFTYNGAERSPVSSQVNATSGSLAQALWSFDPISGHGKSIWQARESGSSFMLGVPDPLQIKLEASTVEDKGPVFATLEITPDFAYVVKLSLKQDMNALSPYNETINIYPVIEYDSSGRILKMTWEQPVISKTNSDSSTGKI